MDNPTKEGLCTMLAQAYRNNSLKSWIPIVAFYLPHELVMTVKIDMNWTDNSASEGPYLRAFLDPCRSKDTRFGRRNCRSAQLNLGWARWQ